MRSLTRTVATLTAALGLAALLAACGAAATPEAQIADDGCSLLEEVLELDLTDPDVDARFSELDARFDELDERMDAEGVSDEDMEAALEEACPDVWTRYQTEMGF